MLSAEFVEADLEPSPRYTALVLVIAGVSSVAIWLSALPLLPSAVLQFTIMPGFIHALRHTGLRSHPRAVVSMRGRGNEVAVLMKARSPETARLCEPIVLTRFAVYLTLELPGGERLGVPVPADAMTPAAFRRLRVFLGLYRADV